MTVRIMVSSKPNSLREILLFTNSSVIILKGAGLHKCCGFFFS